MNQGLSGCNVTIESPRMDQLKKLIREILPHYYLEVETVWKDVPEARTQELIRALRAIANSAKYSAQSANANPKASI